MTIEMACPHCQNVLKFRDELAGRKGKCPKCTGVIEVPQVAAAAPAAAVPASKPAPKPAAAKPAGPATSATKPAAAKPAAAANPTAAPVRPAHPVRPPQAKPLTAAPSAASPAARGPIAFDAPDSPFILEPAASTTAPQPHVAPSPAVGPTVAGVSVASTAFSPTNAPTRSPQIGAAAPLMGESLRQQVMGGFLGPIQPVPVSFSYRLGIILSAMVMLLMPIVYFSMIGVVALAMWWHLTNNMGILGASRGRGGVFLFIIYLMPVVVGAALIFFMIKPLFSRSSGRNVIRSLSPQSDPLLFEFVHRVCAIVGAPAPRRIDVDCDINASAGFRNGIFSLMGSDLVLTIGLPLAGGLSLEQFAGVLAHEFGHFAQGTGMRITYITRSINHWFLFVVYQRDRWDDMLVDASQSYDIRISWVFYLARFVIWIVRMVLLVLMKIGHAATGYMLQQMEYDADRYEARVGGSHTFEATSRQIQVLGLAHRGAQADLEFFFKEGRLADNLPRLILANVRQLPAEALEFINDNIKNGKTELFDTHPCDRDRITSAWQEQAPGVYRGSLPASVLFTDYDTLARIVTWDYYFDIFGDKLKREQLHPVEQMVERSDREMAVSKSLDHFYLDAFSPLRPLLLPAYTITPTTDGDGTKRQLIQARNEQMSACLTYRQALKHFKTIDKNLVEAARAMVIYQASAVPDPQQFEHYFNSSREAYEFQYRQQQELVTCCGLMQRFETAIGWRVYSALVLLANTKVQARIEGAAEKFQQLSKLLPVVTVFAARHQAVLDVRNSLSQINTFMGHYEANQQNGAFFSKANELLSALSLKLITLADLLDKVDYPFDHAEGKISLRKFLLPENPDPQNVGQTADCADKLLDNLISVYVRCVGRLCVGALEVEKALGLEPLVSPPVEKEK